MKSFRSLAPVVCLVIVALSVLASGCASSIIGAASTKIEASAPTGEKLSITLPKDYDARNLHVLYDPVKKQFELKAESISASSKSVVEGATQAQANATAKVAELADKLANAALGAPKP